MTDTATARKIVAAAYKAQAYGSLEDVKAIRPSAATVRAALKVAGIPVARVTSGRSRTWVNLEDEAQLEAAGDALRQLWTDGDRRIYVGVSCLIIHRDSYYLTAPAIVLGYDETGKAILAGEEA